MDDLGKFMRSMLLKGGDKLWSIGADIKEHGLPVHGTTEKSSLSSHGKEGNMIVMTDVSGGEIKEELNDLTCATKDLVDASAEASVN